MSESDIIKAIQTKIANNLHVAMPAIIEEYNFKQQRASVKIVVQQLYESDTYIDYPILSGVPVIFPNSGGASITMPVNRGDSCLVLFLDRDSRAWLLGGVNVKPKSKRVHHLSDAVAIMGLSPFSKASPAKNNTDVLINFSGSSITLKPQGKVDIVSAKEVNVKTENIVINCKTASVKAEETVAVECKSASVKAQENIAIECKTANIKANEATSIDCKTLTATVGEAATINCQSASIKANGTINTEATTFTQKGKMKIEGDIEVTGTSKLTGNVDCTSTIKGNTIEGGTVKTTSGKNLATHTHSYIMPIAETTPTQVTPNTPTGTAN